MPTATPAVVRASTIRAFLRDVLGDDADLPCRYIVSTVGVLNHTTGVLTECDTTPFYDAVGADIGEKITIGTSALEISRYAVVDNDLQ